jgi:uncharacterized membrane protein YjgN (DUF898 family)
LKYLIVLFTALILTLGMIALIAANVAQANTAQAAIEAAKAAQRASEGQMIQSGLNTLLIFMFLAVIVGVAVIVAFLLWRQRRLEHLLLQQQDGGQRWASGPNARWQKIPTNQQQALPPGVQNIDQYIEWLDYVDFVRQRRKGG